MISPGLYFITDSTLTQKDILSDTKAALEAGVKTVQFREKQSSMLERYTMALKLKALCHQFGALLIINDGIDLALAIGADGIHIGQDDMPFAVCKKLVGDRMIIGLSTHSVAQAIEAEELGADYIGFGPVFTTSTKLDAGTSRGVEELAEVVKTVKLPIVAIGGIKTKNLASVVKTKVSNVAIISEIITATCVKTTTTRIINQL